METVETLSNKCLASVTLVTRTVLDDGIWRSFGFKRRPQNRGIFDRLRNARQVDREIALWRELVAASVAAIVRWAVSRQDFRHGVIFLARLMELCVDGPDGTDLSIWKCQRFASRQDAIEFLTQACIDYSASDQSDQPRVMLQRLSTALRMDISSLPVTWVAGAASVFSHPDSVVFNVARMMTEIGPDQEPENDIVLNDLKCHYAIMRVVTRGNSAILDDEPKDLE